MSKMRLCVGERYRLDRKVGSGSFGVIYLATDITCGERVAIKMELRTAKNPKLEFEYKIYQILAGGVGISHVHWFGRAGDYNALVLDILGPSLRDLFRFCGRKFTLKTVLMLADQLLERIKYIHDKNFIHRDIKPANFVMGLDMKELNQVYVIDFGLAKSYRDPKTRQHIPCVQRKSLTGTVRYASINAQLGIEQSRRDDLESLGFVLIYFALGQLPWQGLKADSRKRFHQIIVEKKISTPVEILCRSLPPEFGTYLNYCRTLVFHKKPEYNSLRHLFRKVYFRRGFSEDYLFDWTVLNMKYSASRKKMVEEYKDDSPRERINSSRRTKTGDKSGEQHDDAVCISKHRNNIHCTLLNMNYSAIRKQMVEEYKDDSPREPINGSKETKTSDKSGEQHNDTICILKHRSNIDWTVLNMNYNAIREQMMEEYKDDSPRERINSSKETKTGDTSGEQHDATICIPKHRNNSVKTLRIADYI